MLADYRQRVKAQFDVLVQEARTQRDKFDAVVAGVKPVLDCVDLDTAPQPDGRPPHSDSIIQTSLPDSSGKTNAQSASESRVNLFFFCYRNTWIIN